MKYCPKCLKTYTDETFSFCLEDGSVLVDKSASNISPNTIDTQSIPTEFLPLNAAIKTDYLPAKTESKTEVLPPNATVASNLSSIIDEMNREVYRSVKYPQEGEIAVQIADGILIEGANAIARGKNPQELAGFLKESTTKISNLFDSLSQPLSGLSQVSKLVFSACQDQKLTELITQAIGTLGKEGVLLPETGQSESTLQIVRGIQFERGFFPSDLLPTNESDELFLNNLQILLINGNLTNSNEISLILRKLNQSLISDLLIIVQDLEENVLNNILREAKTFGLNVAIVKAPGFGDRRVAILHDLAILTNARVFVPDNLTTNLSDLGQAVKACITRDATVIVGAKGNENEITLYIEQIIEQLKTTYSEYDSEKMQERLDKIFGNVAVLRIGGFSEAERQEKLKLCNRALQFISSANYNGIIPGAHLTLANLAQKLREQTYISNDVYENHLILANAFEIPFKNMFQQTSQNADKTLQDLRTLQMNKNDYSLGYSFRQNNFTNLIDEGIVMPTNIVKWATEAAILIVGRKIANLR